MGVDRKTLGDTLDEMAVREVMAAVDEMGAMGQDTLDRLATLPLEHNARAGFPLRSNAYGLCLDLGLDPGAAPVHVGEFGTEFGLDVAGEPIELVRLVLSPLETRQQTLLVMTVAHALRRDAGEVRRALMRRGLLVSATGAEVVRV